MFDLLIRCLRPVRDRIGTLRLESLVRVVSAFRSAVADEELRVGVSRRLESNTFEDLWAVEGAGFSWGARGGNESESTVFEPPRVLLPAAIPLHAGIGTGLAVRLFETPEISPADRIERFLDWTGPASDLLCPKIAFEPLGLVTATRHRGRFREIAELVGRLGEPTKLLFWHGVGRAMYLANPPVLTSHWSIDWWSKSHLDRDVRSAIMRGFVLALSLVNIVCPPVLESFCRRRPEVIRHGWLGLEAAVRIWCSWLGREQEKEQFGSELAVRVMLEPAVSERLVGSLRGSSSSRESFESWNHLYDRSHEE